MSDVHDGWKHRHCVSNIPDAHDQEWWPSTVFATVCNGKTFREELGDGPDSRDKRKSHAIPDDMLDKQANIRIIGGGEEIGEKVLAFHHKIAEQAIIVLEEYGILLAQDWTVMGDDVLARSERRHAEKDDGVNAKRKVLSVVEDGVARMIGSFKCDQCRDTGMCIKPGSSGVFCECDAGKALMDVGAEALKNTEEGDNGSQSIQS